MPNRHHIFFDFDDTLSDLQILRGQYVSRLSALLSNRFGREPELWARELVPALESSVHRYVEAHAGRPEPGYARWIENERAQVARELFAALGISVSQSDSMPQLAMDLQAEALKSCNAIYPGAVSTLCGISSAGFAISLSSSQESGFLRPALHGTGLERTILNYYGPDLVDYPKEGPLFYSRVFNAIGVDPVDAIVVDDQTMCLDWAEETGARVIQACLANSCTEPEFPVSFANYEELPRIVDALIGRRS